MQIAPSQSFRSTQQTAESRVRVQPRPDLRESHPAWQDCRDANLGGRHGIVKQDAVRDKITIPAHDAASPHRVHSGLGCQQFDAACSSALDGLGKFRKYLARSRREKYGHNPLLSLTCSHGNVSPSRNSQAERSRWRISSAEYEPSISSRKDSIDS